MGCLFEVMKTSMFAIFLAIAGCASLPEPKEANQPVPSVDLAEYMGRWYAVASLPAWFQRDCHCVKAEYSMMKDYVAVINSCRKGSPDAPMKVSTAKAFMVPGSNGAELRVQFFWPFKGDYWIIALDEDYRWAMVGHPSRKYLWIMSRTPGMDQDVYETLVGSAEAKGYPVHRLERIPQGCEPYDSTSASRGSSGSPAWQ